jgi:hypothetical protein
MTWLTPTLEILSERPAGFPIDNFDALENNLGTFINQMFDYRNFMLPQPSDFGDVIVEGYFIIFQELQ